MGRFSLKTASGNRAARLYAEDQNTLREFFPRMLKQWLKQIFPAHWRPYFRKLQAWRDRIAGLPILFRLSMIDRHAVVAANLARRDRRVVFVAERPSWREAKIAYGLKQAGWDVILLRRYTPNFNDLSDFVDVLPFSSPAAAVEIAHRQKAALFHTFAPSCDSTIMALVHQKPGRVITDFYDNIFSVAHGMPALERKFADDIAQQEFCLENADAIVSRDLQLQYHRKYRPVGRGRPLLLFPEYCWDREPLPQPRRDGATHVVQIGWMGFEQRGEQDVGAFPIIRAFVEAGCHFHIYLHPSFPPLESVLFRTLFQDYLALRDRTGRLHFHATVPPQQLVHELTQYDFGFNMINGLSLPGIAWHHSNPARSPYCGSSRLFDYLDAGLGMIVDGPLRYMRHTFEPYRIVLDGTARLRSGSLADMQRPAPDQIARARMHLSVARNAKRLTDFYDRLR